MCVCILTHTRTYIYVCVCVYIYREKILLSQVEIYSASHSLSPHELQIRSADASLSARLLVPPGCAVWMGDLAQGSSLRAREDNLFEHRYIYRYIDIWIDR